MEKTLKTATLFCVALFLFSLIPTTQAQTVIDWTWSDQLGNQAYGRWEVNMTWDGTPIDENMDGGDGPPFRHGSVIEVWVHDNPSGLTIHEGMTSEELDSYFDMCVDGDCTVDPEVLPAAIFPNTYIMSDGTTRDVFQYLIDNAAPWPFFENEPGVVVYQHEINSGNHWIGGQWTVEEQDFNRTVDQWWNHHVDSGFLHWFSMSETYTNGSQMLASIGVTDWHYGENGGDGDDIPEGAHFSSLIHAGDYFEWTTLDFQVEGMTFTTPNASATDVTPYIGMSMSMEILGELSEIDLFSENSVNPDDYIDLKIDGTHYPVEDIFKDEGDGEGADFFQWIYPKDIIFDNGTEFDFFEYILENQEDMGDTTVTVQGDSFIVDWTEDKESHIVNQHLEFNKDTGVMRNMVREETTPDGQTTIFRMEFEIVTEDYGSDGPGDSDPSSSAELPLPAPSLIWIIPGLVTIPFIRKKTR